MIPKPATTAPTPLTSMLMSRAKMGAAPKQSKGPAPQQPGAPMPLNAGGHAAAKYGHEPAASNC